MLLKFERYLKQRNMSVNTLDNYIRDLKQFSNFIKVDIEKSTRDDINNFIYSMMDVGINPSTINRKISSIKTFFKFLCSEGLTEKNSSEFVEFSKVPKKLPKVPDTTDLLSVINRVDNERDKLILDILYCTGLRRFELVKIRLSDINFTRGFILVMGKGSKERVVPIHQTTLDRIKEYQETNKLTTWLFPSSKVLNAPMSVRRLNEIVQYWANKVGVIGVTPHRMRAHLATNLYKRGADIKAIQDILGHESITTTNIYTKSDIDRTILEYNKMF
jgi:integrase/recombinase XerD